MPSGWAGVGTLWAHRAGGPGRCGPWDEPGDGLGRVPVDLLEHRGVDVTRVREAIGIAVDRSWRGARWTRSTTTGPPARIAPTCPVHHYDLAMNGWCTGCDDVAPAQ